MALQFREKDVVGDMVQEVSKSLVSAGTRFTPGLQGVLLFKNRNLAAISDV